MFAIIKILSDLLKHLHTIQFEVVELESDIGIKRIYI